MAQAPFQTRDPVDFVIVGSGAAGGVMAKELATAGHSVVLMEQGPHLQAADFKHDEWGYKHNNDLKWGRRQGHPQTFRKTENDVAEEVEVSLGYAHNVGCEKKTVTEVLFCADGNQVLFLGEEIDRVQQKITVSQQTERAVGGEI